MTLVAPLVGAWIEITECDIKLPHFLSLPSWERGLKLYANGITIREGIVAPLVGAWIEIPQMHRIIPKLCVAPLVGAWIEMY